ncbi:DsbA family protein [Sulfurovum sp. XGS-02]|uniref:DsbA family protein n=1 Tax=Sulfurovum sp. XGS-02 TaxID=2925411 RepID=UPI0020710816|nr:DsbA family protein [Sulfurovum sp. XGS-02]UPT77808.1 DsbA family protein [Sulfurovum sp. XGS-02]
MQKELILVLDPMCSWCWGFAPVIEELRNFFHEKYAFSLVLGGLRTKGEMPWDERSKVYLKEHWKQVTQRTGQVFSEDLFEKEFFDYDTYPACKAVITVRELFGMQSAFDYLHTIQEAFYTRSEDITKRENLTRLLHRSESDQSAFSTFFESDRAELLMEHDFAKARSMGANAFPSVVVIDEEGHMVCQKGYRSLQEMITLLEDLYA